MRSNAPFENETRLVQTLHRIVDGGLACVLFVAPLAMAGRFAVGRLLLLSIVGVTATAWAFSRLLSTKPRPWYSTGLEWLAVFAVLLVLLQVLPLPSGAMQSLSPTIGELLPMHHGIEATGEVNADAASTENQVVGWNYLSLAPHATRGALAMALCYVLLFGVVSQRLRNREDIEFLMKAIALAGVSMAVIGLTQRFLGNGKFLWFIEHPSRDTLTAVKGTFANENHFVHFLALSLGPLLWWVVKEQSTEHGAKVPGATFGRNSQRPTVTRNQVLSLVGLGLVLLAALMSFSRGGIAVLAIAGVVTISLLAIQRRVGIRAVAALSTIAVIAILCLWIHGKDLLTRELETLQTASIESLDQDQGRRKIWSAVSKAIPEFALVGSGVGSHRYIYPTYFRDRAAVQYTHAESGYLQVLLETGSVGFLLLCFALGLTGWWGVRGLRSRNDRLRFIAVPLAACWTVSVVHAVFDFNWFIPANMCLTVMVVAMLSRLWQLQSNSPAEVTYRKVPMKRIHWAVATCGIAVVAMFSTSHYIGPAKASASYNEYRAWSLATNRFASKSIGPGRQRSLGFVDPGKQETTQRMIELLDQSLDADPFHGRGHVRMAALCLRQFGLLQGDSESGMDLAQIRDAALASQFPSHEDMVAWVYKVAGENAVYLERVLWHAKKGVSLTPTEGNGYLYLGEVAFLDRSLMGREAELLEQAYAVRPYDPSIQFVHGRNLLLSGKSDEALALWKDAFRRGSAIRQRVIQAIAFQSPPQEILDVFQPDLNGLRDLFDFYRRQEALSEMQYIGQFYVAEIENKASDLAGEQAGKLWFDAQFVYATLGNVDAAADAAANSVLSQPSEYRNHYACALRMRDAERWEEALKQFRWCQQRRPENRELPIVVNEMKRLARQADLIAKPTSTASFGTMQEKR